jgi:DNA-binding transcriptional LysR family regulator
MTSIVEISYSIICKDVGLLHNMQLPVLSTAQLAYVCAIDRHRTWAEAATSLGVTASALSQGVAELERRLGVPLYAADGRRRVPLAHTATVVQYAERMLADTDELGRWLRAIGSGQVGKLRVGMIDIVAVHHCRTVIDSFRRRHPELDMAFTVAPTGELLEQLRRSEIDVALCVDPEGVGDFDAVPLLRDELAVYAPIASTDVGPPMGWGPWLLFPETSRTRRAIERRLRALGARVDVAMESHQPDVLREMVRMGLGWTVLPTAQAEHGPNPLRRALPEPLVTRTIGAVTCRRAAGHPAARRFVDELVAARELGIS